MLEFIILFYYYFPRKCDTYPGSLYQSVHNKNLALAITLPFLNISSSNFQIILLMMTQTE